ncbi:MAG TPA: hypothetical protein VGM75_15910, partial [Pseudonocardiaceae bacterium]
MSRAPWRGRPAGRHAAPARGRNKAGADGQSAPPEAAPPSAAPPGQPPWAVASAPVGLFGAPTMADAPAAPLVSPVTDAARAAVAESAADLPGHVPAG